MRRLTSLAAAAALLALLLPANVAAATRATEQYTVLGCGLESDQGTLSVYVESHSLFGTFADIAYWGPGIDPTFDPPTLLGFGEDVTVTATSVDATLELFEEATGEPAGTATLDATLIATGEPQAFTEVFRQGNRWERISGVQTFYDVSGTADLEGVGTFDLAMGCGADSATINRVFNEPASHVFSFDETFVSCTWEIESTTVSLAMFFDSFGGSVELFVLDATGEFGGFGEAFLEGGAIASDFEIFDLMTEVPAGSGAVEGTTSVVGGRSRSTDSDGLTVRKIVSRALAVEGVLTFEIDGVATELAMTSEVCFGQAASVRGTFIAPKGPKATVMANDAPDGAVALTRLPSKVLTNTGLTSLMPEVPCIVEQGDETSELPFGSTAWWTFTGNGQNVTVDTARSTFDTALGIYRWDGTAFVPLDCVDDIVDGGSFSLLAAATVPTESGATYHVQIGGFGGDSGRLQFTVR